MKKIPRLRSCSVFLGCGRDNGLLRSLAENMVISLTGADSRTTQANQLRWDSLPKEIRLHILIYTDLVRPTHMENGESEHEVEIKDGVLNRTQCCWNCSEALVVCNCSAKNAAYSDTCL